jgi:hypothetical protein
MMGLAPSKGGNLRPNALTIVEQMVENPLTVPIIKSRNNLLESPLVGLYLQPSATSLNLGTGELTFGFIDNARYIGSPVKVPNVSTQGLWEAPIVLPDINYCLPRMTWPWATKPWGSRIGQL